MEKEEMYFSDGKNRMSDSRIIFAKPHQHVECFLRVAFAGRTELAWPENKSACIQMVSKDLDNFVFHWLFGLLATLIAV